MLLYSIVRFRRFKVIRVKYRILCLILALFIFILLSEFFVTPIIAKGKSENPGNSNQVNIHQNNGQGDNQNNGQSNINFNNGRSENKEENGWGNGNNENRNIGQEQKEMNQNKNENKQKKLSAGRLQSCQAKEDSIKKRAAQLTQLAENMQVKFDLIANRVEEYYLTKVSLDSTISNYHELVADVQTKKTAIQTQLSIARVNTSNFNCGSDDPKGQLTQYREDMQAVKNALKDYRTSIRNLIVGVHSLNKSGKDSQTISPEVSKSE